MFFEHEFVNTDGNKMFCHSLSESFIIITMEENNGGLIKKASPSVPALSEVKSEINTPLS